MLDRSFEDCFFDHGLGPVKPSLLLGNGFSIACRPNRFRYSSLFEVAGFSERVRSVLTDVGVVDFEEAIRLLEVSSTVVGRYGVPGDLCRRLVDDAQEVRTCLIEAIKERHPATSADLTPGEATSCARFLRLFDNVFTTNYDLLLYWVINIARLWNDFRDGFQRGTNGRLIWNPESWNAPNVFFLHGALHIFKIDDDLIKLEYSSRSLLEQIDAHLKNGRYPLFVAEGSADRKIRVIKQWDFLEAARRALADLDVPLFVFGFSFTTQDAHIADAVARSAVPVLVVSVNRKSSPESRDSLRDRVRSIREIRRRINGPNLEIDFFDADSASIWPLGVPGTLGAQVIASRKGL